MNSQPGIHHDHGAVSYQLHRQWDMVPGLYACSSTAIVVGQLEDRLNQIEGDQLSSDEEELIDGMVAIAVPVYDRVARQTASLGPMRLAFVTP